MEANARALLQTIHYFIKDKSPGSLYGNFSTNHSTTTASITASPKNSNLS